MLTTSSSSETQRANPPARAAWRCAGRDSEASLGIYTKSASLPCLYDFRAAKLERFGLQSVVRDLLPVSRTAGCLRFRRATKEGGTANVEVWRHAEFQTAHYQGLQVCGSVWQCPVCSAKISERRRIELAAAIAMHKAKGGEVLLLTLTNKHDRRDDLKALLDGQARALKRFMRGTKAAKAWFDRLGSIGTIRAMEVTHGDANGWHPHYHVLVFVQAKLDLAEVVQQGAKLWQDCCRLAGLAIPSIERGLTLQGGDYAAKYVGKWGLEQEMTKGHQKKARAGGATPFDLLRRVLADRKDLRSGSLFREFAQVFKGRRQLVWSKGLKAMFAIEEQTDEALSEGQTEGAELWARLSIIEWRQILRFEKQGAFKIRGQILDMASQNDRFTFELLRDALKVKVSRWPIPSRGSFVKVAPVSHASFMNTPLSALVPRRDALGLGCGVAVPPAIHTDQ